MPVSETLQLGLNGAWSLGLGAEVKVRPQPPLQVVHFLSQTLVPSEGCPMQPGGTGLAVTGSPPFSLPPIPHP